MPRPPLLVMLALAASCASTPPQPPAEYAPVTPLAANAANPSPHAAAPIATTPGTSCKGRATKELAEALRASANRGVVCYQDQLRSSGISGKMLVHVMVAADGATTGVSIETDPPSASVMEPCVRALFEGRLWPPPEGGCVTVNIPIWFRIKDKNQPLDGGVPDGGWRMSR